MPPSESAHTSFSDLLSLTRRLLLALTLLPTAGYYSRALRCASAA